MCNRIVLPHPEFCLDSSLNHMEEEHVPQKNRALSATEKTLTSRLLDVPCT